MEWWEKILAYLVQPVSIAAVLAYFGKRLVEQYLNKRVETYKAELKREGRNPDCRFLVACPCTM